MKNWTLVALGMTAAGAMMISSAACTVGSDSGTGGSGGSDTGTGGTTAAAGTGGTTAAAGSGGTTAAAGTTGAAGSGTDNSIVGVFPPGACHDCLAAMTGNLMLMTGMVDCGTVAAACGPNDEQCGPVVSCIDKYQTANPMAKLDCAVDKCLDTTAASNDFFNCAADRCGTQCELTVGFTTTGCP